MRSKRIFFLRVILLGNFILFATTLFAQPANSESNEELKLQLQIRPRAEFRNGVFTPLLTGQQPAAFVSQRNRLGLLYTKEKLFSAGLTLQMLNVWGNDPQVQQTASNISLFEAWGKIRLANTTQLKFGRQVFSYDDERILGALDWHNAGRKHDAALLMFEKGKVTTHVALAFNQNSEKVTSSFYADSLSQPYKNLQFAWLQYQLNDSLRITSLIMNQARQRSSDSLHSFLQTFGVNAYYKTNRLSATASVYYQSGKTHIRNATAINTSAWMAAVYANYSINKIFAIGGGSDYLSGIDMGSTSKRQTAFNPLYGTHHKFYGYMDYFYVASPHNNTGLWDSYANASFKPGIKTVVQLAIHHFVAPVRILNYQLADARKYLGNEFDLSFNYSLDNAIKITGGYGHMLPSASMKYIKNITDKQQMKTTQNWVWLSVVISPEIKIFKRAVHNN